MSTEQTLESGPTLDHLLEIAHGNETADEACDLGGEDPAFPDFPAPNTSAAGPRSPG